ncbi:MAG TPA: hypothetical protein VIX20_17985, partial [Ktedonobacteraceae bacterium]
AHLGDAIAGPHKPSFSHAAVGGTRYGSTSMTQTDLEHTQKAMQQQWYDLVMAEQQGSSLDALEYMYDTYILLAEEYNRCYEASQQEHQASLRNVA